ncbi:MAG: GerMN domain-containing protein [Actinomycetota bacterium]|nr:GerMN domain-containing protein [Actinomycetota bacterium]
MTLLGAAALMLASCSVSSSDTAVRIGDDAVPYGLLDPDASRVVPDAGGENASLCLLRGDLLVPVTRRVDSPAALVDIARALAEVTSDEAADDLRTSVVASDEILGVRLAAGVATVELAAEASQRLTADPLATVAQLVCTLTRRPGVGLVRFTVAGLPVDIPLADGTLSTGAVSADDYGALVAPS